MSIKQLSALALIPALLFALSAFSYAQEDCTQCGKQAVSGRADACPHNWIELGVALDDVQDSTSALNRYGEYPRDWLTSGRLDLGGNSLRKERFELRWWDVAPDNGRVWNRLGVHPVTLEWDAALMNSFAWDARHGTALQAQQTALDSIQLRIHRGELDNMKLTYDGGEFNRKAGGLGSYNFGRVGYQYNFKVRGARLRGQFKTAATEYDAPVAGIESGKVSTSTLKLNGELNHNWDAYVKASQTTYKYDEMADDEAMGSDMTVGMHWRPTELWELDANYRTKASADDNVVSSHVTGFNELGFAISCVPCNGNRYEAGYSHKTIDFDRLRTEDPVVENALLHTAAVATPGQLAGRYDSLSPEQDHLWFNIRQKLGRKLNFTSRVDYIDGDAPASTVPTTYSASLFSDKRFKHTEALSYNYDASNQLGLTVHGQKAYYDTRDTDFGLSYLEGNWTHSFGNGKNLLFAYRDTRSDLDSPAYLNVYNSDDTTYLANFSHELPNFRYALDFSLADGSGYEAYRQTALGADFGLKRYPLGLRLDWIDRQYDNTDGMDTQGLEVALTYKFDF
jgi:hypothetical protein